MANFISRLPANQTTREEAQSVVIIFRIALVGLKGKTEGIQKPGIPSILDNLFGTKVKYKAKILPGNTRVPFLPGN